MAQCRVSAFRLHCTHTHARAHTHQSPKQKTRRRRLAYITDRPQRAGSVTPSADPKTLSLARVPVEACCSHDKKDTNRNLHLPLPLHPHHHHPVKLSRDVTRTSDRGGKEKKNDEWIKNVRRGLLRPIRAGASHGFRSDFQPLPSNALLPIATHNFAGEARKSAGAVSDCTSSALYRSRARAKRL